MFFLDHIWLIPLLPAFGATMMCFFGRKLQKQAVDAVCVGVVVLAFLLACGAVWQYTGYAHDNPGKPYEKILYTWLGTDTGHLNFVKKDGSPAPFHADAGFLLDPLSAIWLLFVTGVGMLIHIYSTGYMAHEGGYYRFFGYLNLFMFSMLTLVLGNNYLMMFVGWEGVGLCSYLLIGYYFHKKSAGDAAKKAFVVNRVGDWGFSIGIMLIFVTFGTLEFTRVGEAVREGINAGSFHVSDPVFIGIALALFIGATGKSAQVPLYVWLPDAMEGPTPVSALIHAATMVTAGVYMVARCNALYSRSPETMTIIATIGALTAVFAATIGFAQTDIKRVLAYSTVSQLGYMFAALGVGAFAGGIFHLMTHAFFKALLFLGSGAVIMAMHHEQDMRKMGGLRKHLPATYQTMLIGTLAIAGVPGLAGFFSKDEILWKAWSNGHPGIWFALWLGAGMTAFYMFRLIFLTFWGEERMDEHTKSHLHEPGSNVIGPLVALAFLSVVGGYVGLPAWLGGSKFERFLEPVLRLPENPALAEAHHPARQEILFTFLSVAIAAAGIFLAHYCYVKNPSAPEKALGWWPALHRLVYRKYYVDEIYDALFENRAKDLANACFFVDSKFVDGAVNGTAATTRGTAAVSGFFEKYVLDGLVNLIGWINMMLNRVATSLQTGLIQRYALGAVFGIVVFILIYFNGLLNF